MHTDITELGATLQQLHELHSPFHIYDECGHDHQPGDPGVIVLDEVDMVTCAEGIVYDICRHCCTSDDGDCFQTEDCATYHRHGPVQPICKTAEILNHPVHGVKTPEVGGAA